MAAIAESGYMADNDAHERWLKWCKDIDAKYPATKKKNGTGNRANEEMIS